MKGIEVVAVEQFKREYKRLRKKYQQLQTTVQELVAQLQAGGRPGDLLQDVKGLSIYKVRLPNKDSGKGKSGGFRVIYYVWTVESILLLTIYSKTDQENIASREIREMIENLTSDDTSPSTPPE
jgi:mRNA-degrading endonuclease RelE of RelBE toxin-antitoxin system